MITYRIMFHRLCEFPGSVFVKIFEFLARFTCLNGQNYLILEKLREVHVDFVRTGT